MVTECRWSDAQQIYGPWGVYQQRVTVTCTYISYNLRVGTKNIHLPENKKITKTKN